MEGKFTRGTAWALLAPRRQVTDLGVGGLYLHLLMLSSFPPPEKGVRIALETKYKMTGYKNKSVIRRFSPRTKSSNLSTVWIAYKNKPDVRPFSSGIKGILTSGFQRISKICATYVFLNGN